MTNEDLWDLFEYCPLTGDLIWRQAPTRKPQLLGAVAGCPDHRGYKVVRHQRKQYYQHRLIWQWLYGSVPSDTIDHIDRDKTNNRWFNLRDVSMLEQCANRDHDGYYPHKSPRYVR